MKKVLALVLAVMMMATVAMAADGVVDEENTVTFGGQVTPGGELYVYRYMDTGDVVDNTVLVNMDIADMNADVTSKNYTITGTKYTSGRDLVESIKFDDDNNQLVVKTKEDYTLKQAKRLKVKFTLKGKGKGGDNDARPVTINVEIDVTVGNFKASIPLSLDDDRVLYAKAIDGTPAEPNNAYARVDDNVVYKFETLKDADGNEITKTSDYGTVVLACADEGDTEVTFRGYKNEELFLFNKTAANSALLKAYADQDAEISFLTFVANPTLSSTATIRFYKDEDSHVYIMKDGKLTSEVKWDDDEGCFLLKARTLGSYVFSDKALPFNATSAADNNPDTGANDVVGIATALAAVALVSAAAVSLKK